MNGDQEVFVDLEKGYQGRCPDLLISCINCVSSLVNYVDHHHHPKRLYLLGRR